MAESLIATSQARDSETMTAEPTTAVAGNVRRRKHHSKLWSDAIQVFIPVDVTADLRIAILHTREKRIKSLYKRFPSLKPSNKDGTNKENTGASAKAPASGDPETGSMGDEEEDGKSKGQEEATKGKAGGKKQKKKLAHVPLPDQYGSVLDYLEAKYVRGVQLGDEDDDGDGAATDDGSEGHGSLYSQGSFLDDTDLQRDVAEQVMANTTLTKLELEEDDADFFVNVGNLEIENDQYGEHYDPLQDKEMATKKRKKPQSSTKSAGTPKKKAKGSVDEPGSAKSKKSTASAASQKSKKSKQDSSSSDDEKKKAVKAAKAKANSISKKISAAIKKLDETAMPRRTTKLKVVLTCPANKKPGDNITFSNPHNPGQKLRVKVPKECGPGDTFMVSVPVKQPADDESDGTDHNKFPREFQELVDDYARAYDEYCTAAAEVDQKFALLKEKQGKFDKLVKEFPPNLMTPVDTTYMKTIVRRARQNRSKRKKHAEIKAEESVKEDEPTQVEEEFPDDEEEEGSHEHEVLIPGIGKDFGNKGFSVEDFTR